MKRVDRWESVDGQVFDSPKLCERHEKRMVLCEKLDRELCMRDVSVNDLVEWLERNKDVVVGYLIGATK